MPEKEMETPEGAPCPPYDGEAPEDNDLRNETEADYEAEEKDEVTE